MSLKKIAAFLLCLVIGLPMVSAMATAVTETIETLFPDAAFRTVVVDTFADEGIDLKSLTGQTLIDALENFTGSIDASKRGIKDAHGLQYLLSVDYVNLHENLIEDLYFLGLDDTGEANKKRYRGWQRDDVYNVQWNLDNNPFRVLPSSFGGRLTIKQPGTTHSEYIENFRPRVYLRNAPSDNFAGWFDITRCIIKDVKDKTERFVKLVSIAAMPTPAKQTPDGIAIPNIVTLGTFDAYFVRAAYSNVKKSGTQWIAVGADEELHYWTADEFDSMTSGSQSFKYYMHPQFFIYDKVSVKILADVVLKKVDRDTRAPLAGAKYELFNADTGAQIREYITGADGKLKIEGLAPANYELVEIVAPAGYKLDSSKQNFLVGTAPGATLGGGVTRVQTTKDDPKSGNDKPVINNDGSAKVAGANEVFIAGADGPLGRVGEAEYVDHASPDITLTPIGMPDAVPVTVFYSALDDNANPAPRKFASLSAAAADVNAEKNKNNIIGSVSIAVAPLGTGIIQLTHENAKGTTPPAPPTPPATGDNAPMALYVTLALLALVGITVLLYRSRGSKKC